VLVESGKVTGLRKRTLQMDNKILFGHDPDDLSLYMDNPIAKAFR
jgi:hypothetical protein